MRIQDGSIELKKEQVDFSKIINDVSKNIKDLPENENKNINIEIDEAVSYIPSDKSIMERVVDNLISFAVHNVEENGTISIKVEKINNGSIRLLVIDNGTQIPKKYHDKIFEKFSQAEIKKSGYKVGRGLGLTFCKMAIEAHNGNMKLDLENPIGNKFVIEL